MQWNVFKGFLSFVLCGIHVFVLASAGHGILEGPILFHFMKKVVIVNDEQ